MILITGGTYGDGSQGFDDSPDDALTRLRPLSLYGWSKHVFDQWIDALLRRGDPRPPQWAGLKFFNVYGPNEYDKGKMISVVKVKHDEILAGRAPKLFRSDRPGIGDGEQARDFIWISDVVDVLLWLLDNPSISGLYNVGTGQARTYLDLAYAVCEASGVECRVEFTDMPASLCGRYQSFTQASMNRLREAGYVNQFTPLERGTQLYIQNYLRAEDQWH
ncbi:MAG: NAD-dependent epimerase/dehydratase family protein [Methylocella sp.]